MAYLPREQRARRMSFSVTLAELSADPGLCVYLPDAENPDVVVTAILQLPSNPLKVALCADTTPRLLPVEGVCRATTSHYAQMC